MNTSVIKKYAPIAISDVLSCFGIPTAAASQVYQDILDNRAKEALEILFSEVRQGNFSNLDQNEVVSVIARYQRDAIEGVAKNNLRLMAKAINGMAAKKELSAPSFSRYATILSSLTDKEIRILSVMVKYKGYTYNHKTESDERHSALTNVTIQAEGHLQALMRTGLVNMKVHTIHDISDGTHKYTLTKLMDEILVYVENLYDLEVRDDH